MSSAPSRPSPNVRKCNKATSSQLAESISSTSMALKGSNFICKVALNSELSSAEREAIWSIFESNMKAMNEKSLFGWDPASKQEELFNPLSRFIIVQHADRQSMVSANEPRLHSIIAYTMFRFEREDGMDVVYCYELQVSRPVQRYGLGKFLLQQLAAIGQRWGMQKIMLTVLKVNVHARNLYRSAGFTTDPTSPGYAEDVEVIAMDGASHTTSGETAELEDGGDWEEESDTEECEYVILCKNIIEY